MTKFPIEIITNGRQVLLEVVDFDPWPDPDGYIRYGISGDGRSSIVAIDTSYWQCPIILSEQDAWDYLEQILYPEFPRVYSEEPVFSPAELESIRQAVGKHLNKKTS